jgi:hypothetical protein
MSKKSQINEYSDTYSEFWTLTMSALNSGYMDKVAFMDARVILFLQSRAEWVAVFGRNLKFFRFVL